jgi:hypothetical protein
VNGCHGRDNNMTSIYWFDVVGGGRRMCLFCCAWLGALAFCSLLLLACLLACCCCFSACFSCFAWRSGLAPFLWKGERFAFVCLASASVVCRLSGVGMWGKGPPRGGRTDTLPPRGVGVKQANSSSIPPPPLLLPTTTSTSATFNCHCHPLHTH